MNFKNIHIGQMMRETIAESGTEMSRICNIFNCTEEEIDEMYKHKSLDTEILLRWSKLLQYDFFRVYTQHLILYSPPSVGQEKGNKKSSLPHFRKNIYTKEVIDFILDMIKTGEKTKIQVMEEYNIPKTTLYKWLSKHK